MDTMIPLDTAELLHVTLGVLAAVLGNEGHRWADVAQEMVDTYTHQVVELVGMDALRRSEAPALGVLMERVELMGMVE